MKLAFSFVMLFVTQVTCKLEGLSNQRKNQSKEIRSCNGDFWEGLKGKWQPYKF